MQFSIYKQASRLTNWRLGLQLSLHSERILKIEGIENYLNTIKSAYKGNSNTFEIESIVSSKDSSRIVSVLVNNSGERSCDIFEFDNGVIVREYEFILG